MGSFVQFLTPLYNFLSTFVSWFHLLMITQVGLLHSWVDTPGLKPGFFFLIVSVTLFPLLSLRRVQCGEEDIKQLRAVGMGALGLGAPILEGGYPTHSKRPTGIAVQCSQTWTESLKGSA
jgi:hypothetical protein